MEFRQILKFIRANLWRFIMGIGGLILAILILTIGLIKALIIFGITIACCLIGYFIDKPRAIVLNGHKWIISMGIFGLIIAILMLTIGFFKTLLIVALMGTFGGFGFLVDKGGFSGAKAVIVGFFTRNRR